MFVCGCGDPAGVTPAGGGGSAAGSAQVVSGGTPATAGAGGGVASGGEAPCEFACGGRADVPIGGTAPQAGSGGSAVGSSAGSGGAATAGGAASGCAAGLGLCDDFESYAVGTSPGAAPDSRWMAVYPPTMGVTLAVDGTKAYSGSKALHITASLPKTSGLINGATLSTKPGDAAFVGVTTSGFLRFMMFLGTFTQAGATHERLVRVGPSTVAAANNPQGYSFDLHYQAPATFKIERMNDVYFGSTPPVLGKWVCWEIQYGPNMLNWWMDGVKVTTPSNFPATNMLTTMAIGFETYTPLTAIELWFDDVAFDGKQRIGCPKAP
jgi:hypothetical protein